MTNIVFNPQHCAGAKDRAQVLDAANRLNLAFDA
jgi:hypothetical protein